MHTLSPNSEKILAIALSAFLLSSIVGIIAMIVVFGSGWLRPAAPVLRWDMVLFSNAIFLFVIGWTDFPEKVRQSAAVRVQVQSWTIWQVLLGILVILTMKQVDFSVIGFMFGPALAIMAYSGGAAYRALRA